MILSEFKELMLSKTISRKVIPDEIRLQERVFTALKKIAMDTIPLRLVVQDPTGHSIMRRVDEITYIRFPDMPLYDDSEIDIDMFLLDAAALYVMAGLEKEKASVYMGMYWEILTENDNRLCETYLSTATNESGFDDADFKYSNRGSSLVVNYGQSSSSGTSGNFLTNAELLAKVTELEEAGFITNYTVTENDVINHQEAITITESQISDLKEYIIDSNYIHTDNNFTDTLKDKLDELSNYSHPSSGVAAGTYKSVTVDENGHITSGANPTTLTDFGINDAYTKTEIQTVLPKVGFDLTNNTTPTEGRLAWNIDEGTLDLGLYGAVLQIGQEFIVKIRNTSGSTITNGTVVMATGSIGNSGRITVSPHDGTIANAVNILGVVTQDIANNGDGFATILGKVRGINTTGTLVGEAWTDGTKLYVKPNDGGRLTNVEPSDTETKMSVAYVVKSHTNGTLYVRVLGFDENHYKAWVQTKLNLKADITYVDGLIGDINSALDTINGEVI